MVRVEGKAAGPVRVVSDDGLEIRCSEGGSFQKECRVDKASPGDLLRIEVRASGTPSGTEAWKLRIYHQSSMQVVSVTNAPMGADPLASMKTADGALLGAGVLEGLVMLQSEGVAEDALASGVSSPGMAIPVTAQLFRFSNGGGVLVLEDPLQLLLPGGKWIGAVTGTTPEAGTVDFPTAVYLTGEASKGAGTEVLIDAPSASFTSNASSLSFELLTRFSGVLMGKRSPQARWLVSLSRTGDLPAGAKAPGVPADATPTLLANRGFSPTQWEAAIAAAATPIPDDVSTLSAARKRELLRSFGGHGAGSSTGTLESCNLQSNALDGLSRFALADAWGTEPTSTTQPLIDAVKTSLAGKTNVQVSASLTASTLDRDMPCKVDFPGASPQFTGTCSPVSEAADIGIGALDLCDAMAKAYGCQVGDVSGETLAVHASISYKDAEQCQRSNPAVNLPGTVSKVCRVPSVPAGCAELALCWDGSGGTTPDSVSAPLAGSELLPISGDLKCASGTRSLAMALDVNAELPVGTPERMKASAIAAHCEADLALIRGSAPAAMGAYGDGLKTAFASGSCMDAARYYYAIGLATSQGRDRALDPSAAMDTLAASESNRLVQRWLSLHGFIAREAAEAEQMGQAFRGSGDSSDPVLLSPSKSLEQSLEGWQLLLHPRFATGVDQIPDSVLRAPDYRPLVAGQPVSGKLNHDQPVALPVTILETLDAQLELAGVGSEEAAMAGQANAYEPLSKVMQRAHVVRALAADMSARATAYATVNSLPAPAWLSRYQSVASRSMNQMQRLVARANSARLGDNPLGIGTEDMPLYFFGDEATATTRFSSISDFLIGTPGADAWTPTLVTRASASLEDARAAWLSMRDRDIAVQQSASQNEGYLEDTRQSYGQQLAELCGGPSGLSTSQLIEGWTSFSPTSCHIRSELDGCAVDSSAYAKLMTLPQVKYQMCVVGKLRAAVSSTGFLDDALNPVADQVASWQNAQFPVACGDGASDCLGVELGGTPVKVHVTPASFQFLRGVAKAWSGEYNAAQNACKKLYDPGDTTLPSMEVVANSPANNSACWSGSIGESVFDVRGTQKDLELARSQFEDLEEQYRIAMQSCIIQWAGAQEVEKAQIGLAATMTSIGAVKLGTDIVASLAGSAKEAFYAAAGIDWTKPAAWGCFTAGSIAVVAEAAANVTSLSLQYSMDTVGQWHEVNVMQIQDNANFRACVKDAEMSLVGMRTAALQIERAGIEVQASLYRQKQLMDSAQGVYEEGRAAIESAKGMPIMPVSHDLWVNQKVDTFTRDMRMARRLVFLAVRAVEYETQQTLDLEREVLAATHPKQLQAVLDELWATAATRGVNGKRPTDLKVVLSLRDHLLQIADKSGVPAAEQNLTPAQRFRLTLVAPQYAVYDNKGVYVGQRIPFHIAPLQAIKLGEAQGIPVLSGSDCAERLWSVNASVQGPATMYKGAAPTFVRVELHKQNTFYSQWCTAHATPFQIASVRPSRNLFKDPQAGGVLGNTVSETSQYGRARIEAYFNVDRKQFEADDYANGETSELAARGLYGDYALFLPAEVLSTSGSEGLVLNKIDDVLLRFDYVSVAR